MSADQNFYEQAMFKFNSQTSIRVGHYATIVDSRVAFGHTLRVKSIAVDSTGEFHLQFDPPAGSKWTSVMAPLAGVVPYRPAL